MAVKEYIIHYSEDTRKRHYHQTQSGKVVKVMIQLEIKHEGTWKEVAFLISYDRATTTYYHHWWA
jgi:hypothetical protein